MVTEERLAVFLDYENLALGVRDLGGNAFGFRPIADALAARGRVVVRRAYADWSLFSADRHDLTREHIELIEMPQHQGASRKNAADIKMVVDAIEMAFERDYISTFVICTGDSDFSPLVHKLRELNKRVIGIGVANSTSRLLPAACDEFLFYDRLEGVEITPRSRAKHKSASVRAPAPDSRGPDTAAEEPVRDERTRADGTPADDSSAGRAEPEARPAGSGTSLQVLVAQTLADLSSSTGPITASVLKRTLLRKDPTFNESDYGFRTFGECLRHLEKSGVVELGDGPAAGDPEVSLPERGEREEVFALVRALVGDAGEPVPLSGFKDTLRKDRPGFSEKTLGYRNFLQFARAAAAGGFVDLQWDEDAEDYLLTPTG